MSWGYKITILYLGFVALITTLIVLSMRQRVDLVSADYYEQELHYQDRIDAIDRTRTLKETLTWEINGAVLVLRFPEELKNRHVTGNILFLRPSDAQLDRTKKIRVAGPGSSVPLDDLHRGLYKMQITWKAGETEYFNEGVIQIP